MRLLFQRSVCVALLGFATLFGTAGCGSDTQAPSSSPASGGAMESGKMGGAMESGKMGGAMESGKMGGAMESGKMDSESK